MADEANNAGADQSKQTEAEKQTAGDAKPEAKKEPTAGEVMQDKKEPKEPKMVPEAALIEMKKENKQLARDMKALQQQIAEGATKKEISADLKELAKKYDVSEEFLQDFASSVRAQAKSEAEAELDAKIKPLQEKEAAAERDQKFNSVYDQTLEELPEFKGVAKRETVKALSLMPENANKTFKQILEDNFGHLITGKRTLEATKPRGGKDGVEIDYDRAKNDTAYFKELMADPALKKKYNEGLGKRINL